MIYLDNSSTSNPKPDTVINAAANAMRYNSFNPGRGGYDSSVKTAEKIYAVREKAAEFFGATAENVIFTKNCTEAVNIAMQGCVHSGEHFVISSLEHNAVYRTAVYLQNHGASFSIATVYDDDERTVSSFEEAIRPNTVAVVCTGASNVTGKILPTKEIGEMCKARGILFIVDAAQSAGHIDINAEKSNIDYLCISPHKGLYAPMGIGMMITSRVGTPMIYGGTGSDSANQNMPLFLPDRFEAGTLNVLSIIATGQGIDFVNNNRRRIERERALCEYCHKELSKINGVKIYSAADNRHVPICAFNIGNLSSEEAAAYLAKRGIAVRGGMHCAPLAHKSIGTSGRGCVRASFGVFNTDKDVNSLIYAAKMINNGFLSR